MYRVRVSRECSFTSAVIIRCIFMSLHSHEWWNFCGHTKERFPISDGLKFSYLTLRFPTVVSGLWSHNFNWRNAWFRTIATKKRKSSVFREDEMRLDLCVVVYTVFRGRARARALDEVQKVIKLIRRRTVTEGQKGMVSREASSSKLYANHRRIKQSGLR